MKKDALRYCVSFIALAAACILATQNLRAQAGAVTSTINLNVDRTVSIADPAEPVHITGDYKIASTVSLDQSGRASVTSVCEANGSVTGALTGAQYRFIGADKAAANIAGPLPATVELHCHAHVVSATTGSDQLVHVAFRVAIDAKGNAAAVIRDVRGL